MAALRPPHTGSRYERIPAWLRELDFVTDGFTWRFRLLSRGAEPLMTLSTVYIIIEAGVPAVSLPWLHFLAVALMISAPEIILPGGFILAGEIRAQGNRRAWMLYGMCWLFVALTRATLADLFIWHFTGGAFAALMWGRCAAAVGYSILFRVITYRREVEVMPVTDVQALVEQKMSEMAEALTQRIAESEQQTQGVYTSTRREIETRIEHQLGMISQQFQGEMQTISAQLLTLVSALESLQKQETISLETDTDCSEELHEQDAAEPAREGDAADGQSRKYYMTFAEVSAHTGLSILQLKRRANAGAIEVNAAGKIRVKSLRNLHQNPPTKSRMVASKPALSLVKKEVVNE